MQSQARSFDTAGWRFDNSYARLPQALFSRVAPEQVRRPAIVVLNERLAIDLGLDPEALAETGAETFSGNRTPSGSDPIAQAYAGHQFGHFTNLGDGRAILLGEHITRQGLRCDVQLKGSGRTPYARRGDGRAALGPMLREYIISEAMHALGIPTTRSLAVVSTGEQIVRDELLPGAVLTRVAASHIRVGTFEYAAALGEPSVRSALFQHTVRRHYPELADAANPALALLEGAIERQAKLIAQWMCVGFIHGVMNTDNMAVSGETIDYGPCAFMDTYDPATVFSSIDRNGRYAYGNQATIAQWNLARFAEALLPLIDQSREKSVELAERTLAEFPQRFGCHYQSGLRSKLGLLDQEDHDFDLANELLGWMTRSRADFTNTFGSLIHAAGTQQPPQGLNGKDPEFLLWFGKWTARLGRQSRTTDEVVAVMRSANPAVIPRNHRVEEALDAATRGDLTVMRRLLGALSRPFEETPESETYRTPPPPGSEPYRTFCGT